MKARIALAIAGVLVMLYAVGGGLADPDVDRAGVLVFLAAVLIGHDAVWMLIVLGAGATLARLVPPPHRAAVRTAAISAAALAFVALPLIPKLGWRPGRNLAVVLLAVAAVTVLRSLWAGRRKKSERSARGSETPAGR